jgi:cytidylate kinase
MKEHLLVAIDGPAGAGKSTVARGVAQKLGILYVDTGAMYRAMAWKMLKKGIHLTKVKELTKVTQISITNGELYLDSKKIEEHEIRTREVSSLSSEIAKVPQIRQFLVEKQREIARQHSVVMDGRDIGTFVLPHADVKIFLTASIEERAWRRYDELKKKGLQLEMSELKKEIAKRDYADENRKISPLKQAEDAIQVDTTSKTVEDVITLICTYATQKK